MIEYKELVRRAFTARKKAYAPYSDFQVGAALLCEDGRVYEGCNIENAAFGVSQCAERTALFTAVCEGERSFTAIAVVGGRREAETFELCPPCGICRQALTEFCDPDVFEVVLARSETDYQVYKLKEVFPLGFTQKDMSR